jgi:hypothetical protein
MPPPSRVAPTHIALCSPGIRDGIVATKLVAVNSTAATGLQRKRACAYA